MALVGVIFERLFISRVYGQNVLMQLLVCYGFVLIFDDLVKIIWGPEFQSMGMPPAFQVPPLFIAGGVVPPFYLFVDRHARFIIGLALWLLIDDAARQDDARGGRSIPTWFPRSASTPTLLYALVFALGGGLAGFAGALAAPVRSLSPGMGFSVLIE